jgi:hypothetical protein
MYRRNFGGGYPHQRVVQLKKNKVEAREGCHLPDHDIKTAGWSPNFGELTLPHFHIADEAFS